MGSGVGWWAKASYSANFSLGDMDIESVYLWMTSGEA